MTTEALFPNSVRLSLGEQRGVVGRGSPLWLWGNTKVKSLPFPCASVQNVESIEKEPSLDGGDSGTKKRERERKKHISLFRRRCFIFLLRNDILSQPELCCRLPPASLCSDCVGWKEAHLTSAAASPPLPVPTPAVAAFPPPQGVLSLLKKKRKRKFCLN